MRSGQLFRAAGTPGAAFRFAARDSQLAAPIIPPDAPVTSRVAARNPSISSSWPRMAAVHVPARIPPPLAQTMINRRLAGLLPRASNAASYGRGMGSGVRRGRLGGGYGSGFP